MEEYLLTLLASITVAALFVVLSKITQDERLKRIFFLIALLFVFFLLIKGAIISPENNRLNYTYEDSRYWNCSIAVQECVGIPESEACFGYNEQQCYDIDNCTWNVQGEYCEGVLDWNCTQLGAYGGQLKCLESGCDWNYTLEDALCDQINTTYHYDYAPPFADQIDTMELTEIIVIFTVFLLVLVYFLVDALKFVSDWMQKLQLKFQKGRPPT